MVRIKQVRHIILFKIPDEVCTNMYQMKPVKISCCVLPNFLLNNFK